MKKVNSRFLWSPPPDGLGLKSHQVDIWRAHLGLPIEILNQLEATLSEAERERAARFYFPADKDRFITAHGCLRDILGRYLRCQPGQISFSTNQYGKPALQNHQLEFNLSHSGDFALIAATCARKVGIDVERIRPGISSQVIARHYFSPSEVAELQTLSPEQRETAFFTCWTRKEAYIKAQGLGLSLPLDSFDVSLTPDESAILRATRPDSEEASRWTLFAFETDPCYESAVAVKGKDLEVRLWDWNEAGWETRHG